MIPVFTSHEVNRTKDPVVISNGGKVALSTRTRWNLVYDEAIWNYLVPSIFDKTLTEIINRHTWINVWDISSQDVGNGWHVIRFDENHFTGLIQCVSFEYNDGECEFAWPFYYRGSNDELVKIVPDSFSYDGFRGYYDNGMLFTVEEVRKLWSDMYRRFASEKVKKLLAPVLAGVDWKGQIARLIDFLMLAGRYSDAAEVAYCASFRARRHEQDSKEEVLFNDVADRLFALDKLG